MRSPRPTEGPPIHAASSGLRSSPAPGHGPAAAGGIGHRLRREDDEHRIHSRGRRAPPDRRRVALGRRVAEHVDRIRARRRRRQRRVECVHVSRPSSANSPPRASRASAAITPGPPALVTIPRRARAGSRSRASSSAVAKTW